MGPVLVHGGHPEDEWLEARRDLHTQGYVTASELGTLLGRNPYETPQELLAKRLGLAPPFTGNGHTLRGRCLEHGHITHYNLTVKGKKVAPCGSLYRSTHLPLAATPDAVGDGLVVEIKDTTQVWASPPTHYVTQVKVQMAVMALPEGRLYANLGDKSYRMWAVAPPTQDEMDLWCEEVRKFNERIRVGF